ncbi:MAG TPA: DUF1934 domain-containing protein [Bacillota bacterium]|nr:DUF1934 domain-containing protein [Bacillota bacterium]HQC35624.1 DUF1934 domain-containing protein [Bacillota bacterium]
MLKIKGCAVTSDGVSENCEETMEFFTEGKLQRRGSFMRIRYPESELSGMAGVVTSFIITDRKIRMKRVVTDGSLPPRSLKFEKGKRFDASLHTLEGPIGMEILTNNIVISDGEPPETGEGFSIDYNVSLGGKAEWRQRIDVEIVRKGN